MVTIVLPTGWTGGRTEFEGTAGLLPDVIRRFAETHPEYSRRLLGPETELLRYINYCVDDDLVPRHARSETTVPAGSTVTVIAPMAGG